MLIQETTLALSQFKIIFSDICSTQHIMLSNNTQSSTTTKGVCTTKSVCTTMFTRLNASFAVTKKLLEGSFEIV